MPLSDLMGKEGRNVGRKFEAIVTLKRGAAKSPNLVELADDYRFGDGFIHYSLEVTREGRYHYQWHDDVITHEPHENDRNESRGRCAVVDRTLRLFPEGPHSSSMPASLPNDLVPVRWGGRTYLVPENDRLVFCSVINRGDMPTNMRNGRFASIDHYSGKRPKGMPEVPEEWRPFLLQRPVTAAITELLPNQVVTINAGAKAGLEAGMEICCEHPSDHGSIKILFTENDRSFARSTRAPSRGLPDSSVVHYPMSEPFYFHPFILGDAVWSLSMEARQRAY
jgi:hypothetical protein